MNINGYMSEFRQILTKLNIDENLAPSLTKRQWKSMLASKIKDYVRNSILEKAKSYKKIDYFQMREEQFQLKDYFKTMTLTQARVKFSLDMKMTRTVRSHYFCDKKFSAQVWFCPEKCDRIDSTEHIAWSCKKYDHLKIGKDIHNNDHDMVKFLQEVIKLRDETLTE